MISYISISNNHYSYNLWVYDQITFSTAVEMKEPPGLPLLPVFTLGE